MTHRLATNYAKNYCNRTLIVKVIVENVVTCFLGHGVDVKIADGACLWLSGSAAAKSLRDVTRLISKTAHFDRLAYTKTVPGFTTRSLLRPNGVCVEWYKSASRTLKRRHRSNQHDTYRQRSWLHLILRLSRCSWC